MVTELLAGRLGAFVPWAGAPIPAIQQAENEIAPPHRLPEAQDPAKFGLQFARSNHEIETSEMALNGQFALHQFSATHVGSGSFSIRVGLD